MSSNNDSKSSFECKLTSQKDNIATLTFQLSQNLIKEKRQAALKKLQQEINIKGFRKGKAPLNKVKEEAGEQKLNSTILDLLLPQVIPHALKEHELNLVGNPRLTKLANPDDDDWELELQIPLMPDVKLGDYKKAIKDALAASDIWTPDKAKEEDSPQEKAQNQQQKLNQIFEALRSHVDFEVPKPLVQSEVQRSLSRLVDQTEQLGLTVQEYLDSLGKTAEELKEQYAKTARDNLKLELIIEKIAEEMDIKVQPQEIEALIQASGDEEAKKHLDNPQQKTYIKSILKKRKVVDSLLKL